MPPTLGFDRKFGSSMTGRKSSGPDWTTTEPSCEELLGRIIALTSVDPDVALGVEIGDVLPVQLNESRYPVVLKEGRVLGMLVTTPLPVLVRCLSENGPYSATVVERDNTLIRVRLQQA
jgi:hypothetical protein